MNRCGDSLQDCSNLNISGPVNIKLVKNREDGPKPFGGFQDKFFWSMLDVPAGNLSTFPYNYLICSLINDEVATSGSFRKYACTAGNFDGKSFEYSFRIGGLTIPESLLEDVGNRAKKNVSLEFSPFSNEVLMEYNLINNGGLVFNQVLFKTGRSFIAAKNFLDVIVDQMSAPREAQDQKLWEQTNLQVTDIEDYTIAIYGFLFGLLGLLAACGAVLEHYYGPRLASGHVCTDVTSYNGLAQLLQHRTDGKRKVKIYLGVTFNHISGTYHLESVPIDQELSPLPSDAILYCCENWTENPLQHHQRNQFCPTLTSTMRLQTLRNETLAR